MRSASYDTLERENSTCEDFLMTRRNSIRQAAEAQKLEIEQEANRLEAQAQQEYMQQVTHRQQDHHQQANGHCQQANEMALEYHRALAQGLAPQLQPPSVFEASSQGLAPQLQPSRPTSAISHGLAPQVQLFRPIEPISHGCAPRVHPPPPVEPISHGFVPQMQPPHTPQMPPPRTVEAISHGFAPQMQAPLSVEPIKHAFVQQMQAPPPVEPVSHGYAPQMHAFPPGHPMSQGFAPQSQPSHQMSSHQMIQMEQHMDGNVLIGTWQYEHDCVYQLAAGDGAERGCLRFSEQHPNGLVVAGLLRPHGQWFMGKIYLSDGEDLGMVRLSLAEDDQGYVLVSNLKGPGDVDWDEENLVAYRIDGGVQAMPEASPVHPNGTSLDPQHSYASQQRHGAMHGAMLSTAFIPPTLEQQQTHIAPGGYAYHGQAQADPAAIDQNLQDGYEVQSHPSDHTESHQVVQPERQDRWGPKKGMEDDWTSHAFKSFLDDWQ